MFLYYNISNYLLNEQGYNMNYQKISTALLLLTSSIIPLHASATDEQMLKQEAMGIVKQFGGTLKPQLVKAMKEGGPVHAIDICATQAPKIAKQLSEKTGWEVKRVSLKMRNTNTATPDVWERGILEEFDVKQASGTKAGKLTASIVQDGKFRFMKAQGAQPVCLTCHGTNIKPKVQEALNKHFPKDLATGYTLGQVRGAFSLSKILEE